MLIVCCGFRAAAAQSEFVWPDGYSMALSLSFDDGRFSQVDVGTDVFDKADVKVTYYVVPSAVEQRLEGWRMIVARGHEIGNHTLQHPCSGNFLWARQKALESYTIETMRAELLEANAQIKSLLDVEPESFAYSCGHTFVGRGLETQSYVPLVAELFTSGRGWLDEGPNAPEFVDPAQLTGMEMDGKSFDEIKTMIESTMQTGGWLVLAGHDIGAEGPQTTRLEMLEQLVTYARQPSSRIWIAPVGTVSRYVREKRNLKNQ